MPPEDGQLPFVDEATVGALLTVGDAIDAITKAMVDLDGGLAENQPRRRLSVNGSSLNMLAASWVGNGVYGQKVYSVGPGGAQFWVLLYHVDGRPLAVVAAQRLGRIRTGAATGVATHALARDNASVVGVIGTGYQMQTQVEAVAQVRRLTRVQAWSRDPEGRASFCRVMTERIGVPVVDAGSAHGAVDGADVVITLTTSKAPVLPTDALEAGMHVVAAGSNHAASAELDPEAVGRMDVVVVDDLEQGKRESGELIAAQRAGLFDWSSALPMSRVVADRTSGRSDPAQVTLFKSNGIALWDVACAAKVAELAIAAGRVRYLDLATGPDTDAPARFLSATRPT